MFFRFSHARHALMAASLFFFMLGFVPTALAQTTCNDPWTVDSGDTLAQIADRCDTSVTALVAQNDQIDDPSLINIGWRIDIPEEENAPASPPRQPAPDQPEQDGDYTIKPGDTLYSIAQRFDTTVSALARENQIANVNRIEVGTILDIPDPHSNDEPPVREPSQPERGTVTIRPDSGPPGTRVTITASGFPANTNVNVGAGVKNSEYEILDENLRTNSRGQLEATVNLPYYADEGRQWVFAVETDDYRMKALSEDFDVIRDQAREDRPDDQQQVSVRGQLTNEGVECPALRGQDGTLYTLAGETGRFDEGDYVHVEGTVAEMSICMQGTTISVNNISDWNRKPQRKTVAFAGRMADVGIECPTVRTKDGTLYALSGGGDRFDEGDLVRVEGTVAEVSYCQQGTTIAVSHISRLGNDADDDGRDNLKKVHRVEGTLTNEGVECPALRAEDGTLYTLAGDLQGFEEGDRVYVEGTEPDISTCLQGTTLAVRSIRKAR